MSYDQRRVIWQERKGRWAPAPTVCLIETCHCPKVIDSQSKHLAFNVSICINDIGNGAERSVIALRPRPTGAEPTNLGEG